MSKKRSVIMVKMDPPAKDETEWNNWYHNEHIPNRLAIPGFLLTRRFVRVGVDPRHFTTQGEAKYLALYELASAGAQTSEPYRKLKQWEGAKPPDSFEAITMKLPTITRGVYEQIYPEKGEYQPPPTRFLLIVGHDVPRNRRKEFNAWYDTDHIPAMLRVPGFITARRFMLARGRFLPIPGSTVPVPEYLSIYDIENEHTLESDAFMKAKESPWTTWVRSWSTRRMGMLCRRIHPKD